MRKKIVDPVGTLSIGNVVTSATILYKSNFKRYFQVSLRSLGWTFAAIATVVVVSLLAGIGIGITKSVLVGTAIALAGLIPFFYFWAKYMTARATICRLAYREAIDAPETVSEAERQLAPNTWGFLRLWVLVFILVVLAAFVLAIAGSLLMALLGLAISPFFQAGTVRFNPVTIWLGLLTFLVTIGLFLAWIGLVLRVYSYWFIAELPMAIERSKSALDCMRQSGQLSKFTLGKIVWILAVAFSITLPITLISGIPSFIGQMMSIPATLPDAQTLQTANFLQIVGFGLSLIAELFLMPFWQSVKAILYYDLRNRLEGNDIIRSIESEQPQLTR